jgi:acid phosphatase (class A)
MHLETGRLGRRGLSAVLLFIWALTISVRAGDMMGAGQPVSFHFLEPGKPDPTNLLAPPPLPDSAEQAADLATVREVSRAVGGKDLAEANAEKKKMDMFTFAPVIGDFFRPGKLPETEKFFDHVQDDAGAVVDIAKDFYRRPRPFVADPSLAGGKLEKTFSYPSGHSTESMVLGLLLAELFPEKRDAILAEARRIGWHRVEIARHYPTDIYAGRVLAQAIVKELKKDGKFQRQFAKVQAELAAAVPRDTKIPAVPGP